MISNLNVFKKFKINSLRNVFLSTNNKKVITSKERIQLNNPNEVLEKIKGNKHSQLKNERIRQALQEEKSKLTRGSEEAIADMVPEEDNYCALYYSLRLDKPFDLFDLRDFFYSFMYSRSMKGKCFINVLDGKTKLSFDEKDKMIQNFLEMIDWLGLEVSFDTSLKNKLYESQREKEYIKWLKLLIEQRDAYRCFCKSKKCEGKCETSVENTDSSSSLFTENKDITFIKYKLHDKKYKLHDIISSQNFAIETNQNNEYNLFHRSSPEDYTISSTFKRVVDDEIYKVTHKFELKNKYNFQRHLILSKALLFKEKKYAMLPVINIKTQNKEKLENYSIEYLRNKKFLPEAILNEAALLGWCNLDKEARLEKMRKNENDYLLLDMYNVGNEFDIKKIDDELADFYYNRIYFLNNKSLIRRYMKSNPKFKPMFLTEFKSIFKSNFLKYQDVMSNWNEDFWQKILEIPFIDTYENIPKRYQFLFEKPQFEFNQKNKKMLKSFFKGKNRSYFQNLISDIIKLFEKISNFDADIINRELGLFIYRRNELDKNISNDNIYSLIKFLITGDSYGPYLADVLVVLGKKKVLMILNEIDNDFLEKQIISVISAQISDQGENTRLIESQNSTANLTDTTKKKDTQIKDNINNDNRKNITRKKILFRSENAKDNHKV